MYVYIAPFDRSAMHTHCNKYRGCYSKKCSIQYICSVYIIYLYMHACIHTYAVNAVY